MKVSNSLYGPYKSGPIGSSECWRLVKTKVQYNLYIFQWSDDWNCWIVVLRSECCTWRCLLLHRNLSGEQEVYVWNIPSSEKASNSNRRKLLTTGNDWKISPMPGTLQTLMKWKKNSTLFWIIMLKTDPCRLDRFLFQSLTTSFTENFCHSMWWILGICRYRKLKLEDSYQLQKFLTDAREHVCIAHLESEPCHFVQWYSHFFSHLYHRTE